MCYFPIGINPQSLLPFRASQYLPFYEPTDVIITLQQCNVPPMASTSCLRTCSF
jgi:hypothetical protein